MSEVPNKMKIGSIVAMLGGVISLAAMACVWDGTLDGMSLVGLDMLTAVMFFAVAGTMTKYSPVVGKTVLVLAGLTAAVVVISALYEATFLWVSVILFLLSVVCMLVGACPGVVKWVDANRI